MQMRNSQRRRASFTKSKRQIVRNRTQQRRCSGGKVLQKNRYNSQKKRSTGYYSQRRKKVDVTVSDVSHIEDSTPSPQELEQEDIRNRTLQNPDEVSGVSEQTSEEVPEIAVATDAQEANEEQNTNTKDKSNPVPPTPTQVEDSKPAQDAPTITIVDGGIYVNDGTTFISDEVLAAEAQMLEDTSTEVYGETGYANMKPETVTNNSDALSNRKVQKVKHVSNTFSSTRCYISNEYYCE